jgi:8-oxo-dGTP pyrophosphatase MutT (NUDIX family)
VARLNKQQRSNGGRRARTARATSCGGVVIRETDDGLEICLGRRRRERDGSSWTLPKGTPNDSESVEETALREVAEETGLEVRINAPVGAIEYFFTQSGTRIHKTVHFFLMEATGGSLEQHDHEFDEVRWAQSQARSQARKKAPSRSNPRTSFSGQPLSSATADMGPS